MDRKINDPCSVPNTTDKLIKVLLCLVKRGQQLNQFQEISENLWEIELKIKFEVILLQKVKFSVFTSKNLFWACFLSNIVRATLYDPIFFFLLAC